jgi:hypothetical protein
MLKIIEDIIAQVDKNYEPKTFKGNDTEIYFLKPGYCKIKISWYTATNGDINIRTYINKAIKKGYSTADEENDIRIYYSPNANNTTNTQIRDYGNGKNYTYTEGVSLIANFINKAFENAEKYTAPIHKVYKFAPALDIFTSKDTISVNGFTWAKIKPVTIMPDGVINESEICNPDKEVYFLVNFQLIDGGQLITGQMLYDGKDSFIPVQGSGTKRAHHKFMSDYIKMSMLTTREKELLDSLIAHYSGEIK